MNFVKSDRERFIEGVFALIIAAGLMFGVAEALKWAFPELKQAPAHDGTV